LSKVKANQAECVNSLLDDVNKLANAIARLITKAIATELL